MTKKEYLIKIFQKIEPHRSIIGGFIALLESPESTEADIDKVFDMFTEHINSIQDEEKKNGARKILNYIQMVHEKEQYSKESDKKDLDKLLDELEQIQFTS